MDKLKNEPVMGLVVAFIAAAGGLLAAFGVEITEAQIGAISAFVVAAIALGLYVRSVVTPLLKARNRDGEAGLTLVEALVLLLLVLVVLALVGVLR